MRKLCFKLTLNIKFAYLIDRLVGVALDVHETRELLLKVLPRGRELERGRCVVQMSRIEWIGHHRHVLDLDRVLHGGASRVRQLHGRLRVDVRDRARDRARLTHSQLTLTRRQHDVFFFGHSFFFF